VPLIVVESESETMRELLEQDGDVMVWWATRAECTQPLCRRHQEGSFTDEEKQQAQARLDALAGRWSEVQPSEEVRELAEQCLARHTLKTADALQLSAALMWCEGESDGREFVCSNGALRTAATDEGFRVLPPEEET
jgi:predicted nucleic acid-binding protein